MIRTLLPRTLLSVVLIAALLSSCRGANSEPSATATDISSTPLSAGRLGPTSTASTTPTPALGVTPTATLVPIPPVSAADMVRGPDKAPVTLTVYSDFDCDLCATLASTLNSIRHDHAADVRWVFRPFPLLGVHDKAGLATAAVLAAPDPQSAWQLHDALFDERDAWRGLDEASFLGWLTDQADSLGLNPDSYRESLTSDETVGAVNQAYQAALASGLPGVPFVLLNGTPIVHSLDHATLEAAVRLAILQHHKLQEPDVVPVPSDSNVLVYLHFNIGTVTLRLYPASAPQAVNSFLFLAEKGWYDGSALYYVDPGVLVEGGDPTNTGLGDAGYHFELEIDPSLSFDRTGMIALDNEGPGTNSSRFFVNLSAQPAWDGSYTIFGQVIDGMDLLGQLEPRDPIDDLLQSPEAILQSVEWESE
jgi:peptidyl-prolyl cis-trans isomerase B (cyclophilin B)